MITFDTGPQSTFIAEPAGLVYSKEAERHFSKSIPHFYLREAEDFTSISEKTSKVKAETRKAEPAKAPQPNWGDHKAEDKFIDQLNVVNLARLNSLFRASWRDPALANFLEKFEHRVIRERVAPANGSERLDNQIRETFDSFWRKLSKITVVGLYLHFSRDKPAPDPKLAKANAYFTKLLQQHFEVNKDQSQPIPSQHPELVKKLILQDLEIERAKVIAKIKGNSELRAQVLAEIKKDWNLVMCSRPEHQPN